VPERGASRHAFSQQEGRKVVNLIYQHDIKDDNNPNNKSASIKHAVNCKSTEYTLKDTGSNIQCKIY
jgi:hypothetical protein